MKKYKNSKLAVGYGFNKVKSLFGKYDNMLTMSVNKTTKFDKRQ
jgi:hypothetical protein